MRFLEKHIIFNLFLSNYNQFQSTFSSFLFHFFFYGWSFGKKYNNKVECKLKRNENKVRNSTLVKQPHKLHAYV